MKHTILLIAGIAVSLVFIALSYSENANVYEQLAFNQEFNDELFTLGLYPLMALLTVLLSWAFAAVYYYVINSVYFDRWYHWLVMLLVASTVTPAVCHVVCDNALSSDGVDYSMLLGQFAVQHVIFAALTFIVASYSIRWWSSNCRHTPLPQ
mgnify:CR=1 FL=1